MNGLSTLCPIQSYKREAIKKRAFVSMLYIALLYFFKTFLHTPYAWLKFTYAYVCACVCVCVFANKAIIYVLSTILNLTDTLSLLWLW